MSQLTNKAEEFAGRAKQAAGDITGNDELHAEGTADKARAQFKQGVDTVVGKAEDTADAVAESASNGADAVAAKVDDAKQALSGTLDEAADTARQLHLDDSRVVIAIAAGLAIAIVLVVRRMRSGKSRSTKRSIAKDAAAAGVSRALSH
jgi:uncharacterized protein YjbJ (UPF0337 family)